MEVGPSALGPVAGARGDRVPGRAGGQDHRPDAAHRVARRAGPDDPGAVRGLRQHHPVERARADHGDRRGAGHRRRQHDRGQAGRGRAADLPAAGPAGARGRHPARAFSTWSPGTAPRRARRCPASAGAADVVHRVAGDRLGGHGGLRAEPDPAARGTGRQGAADRAARRGPFPGGAGDRGIDHAEHRAGVRGGSRVLVPSSHACFAGGGAGRAVRVGAGRAVVRGRADGAADQRPAGAAGARLPGHRPGRGRRGGDRGAQADRARVRPGLLRRADHLRPGHAGHADRARRRSSGRCSRC